MEADKLRAEASGILNWMLDGLRSWLDNGLTEPDEVTTATAKYFATADVRAVVSKSHRRFLAAIEQRDAEAARRRSERDIESYAKYLVAALKSAAGGRDA